MTRNHNHDDAPRSEAISRRKFVKLAAMAGLLAGCSPVEQVVTRASKSTSSPPPPPTPTPLPTETPLPAPTATPTMAPSATSTVPPTRAPFLRRPPVIKMYPEAPSRVVQTHHAGVWSKDTLVLGALRQMLDASITRLTGLNDAQEAWAALFKPNERIAIKVNAVSADSHSFPLAMAVTQCLQEAGVPAEQIVIFDRTTGELIGSRYTANREGPGVRCYGTDGNYTSGWTIMGAAVSFSDVLLGCDALINMPILSRHSYSGITFALKNHYGSFNKPEEFHGNRLPPGMAALNVLPPIRERTRLIVGNALKVTMSVLGKTVTGDSILMSFDPVAHDTVGLRLYSEAFASDGGNPEAAIRLATPVLESAAKLGVGTNVPQHMELIQLKLT